MRGRVPAGLVGGAGGGHIGAGANIVVLSQTVSTEMKLVDFALHRWSFGAAQIAATPNPLIRIRRFFSRFPGCDRELDRSRLGINAHSNDESAQRKLTRSELQHVRFRMIAQESGKKA
jgi:hypothetical protein